MVARQLLDAAPSSSASFMIVLTDGEDTYGDDEVTASANATRSDGSILFAIGVGKVIKKIYISQLLCFLCMSSSGNSPIPHREKNR